MNPRRTAQLVGGYALVGALYILFSDSILFRLFPNLAAVYHLGLIKGMAFIGVTAVLLAFILNRIHAHERARSATLFAHHRAVMLLVDPDSGNIVDATPDAERFYGLSREQLLARKVPELELPPETGQPVNWRALLGGEIGTCHCRQVGAGGDVRDVVVHAGPIAEDGRLLRFLIIQDNTVRLRLTEELEQAESRWRFALEGAGHGVWEWNVQTGKVFFSELWKSMLGYSAADVGDTLQEWEKRVHPDDLERVLAAIDAHVSGRASIYHSEHRMLCKDGSWKWVADQGRILTRTADGKPLLMIGTHTDISEQKRAELAVRESEEKLSLFVEYAPSAIAMLDRDLRYVAYSRRWLADYGLGDQDLRGRSHYDVFPELPERWMEIHRACLAGETRRGDEDSFVRADGHTEWLRWEVHPWHDDNASVAGIIIFSEVITERKQAEQKLLASEARYRELFAGNPHPMWVYDRETLAFIAVNDAAVRKYGYSREEFMAMTIRDIRPAEDVPHLLEKISDVDRGFEQSGIWRHRCRDGTLMDVEITSHVLDYDQRRAVLVLAHDVTAQLRAEETIEDYVRRLEAAVLGTATAVAQMVELRDPYTAGHERRVGELSAAIAAEMGLDDNMQRGLRVAGAVHDVGKIVVPAEILSKPGRLTEVEYQLVQQHAQQGYEVLKDVAFPWPVAEVARQHHERLDGSGYPRGLKGDEILLEARIMAVADVVESMSTHRPYRPGLGIGKALAEIEGNAGRLYDTGAATACLRLFRDRGYEIPD